MFKNCLLLSSILTIYMHAMEQNKQVIHLHTCKDDLDIRINPCQTVRSLKEIFENREGIDPTLQAIAPIWRQWLFFKKIGPTLSDDQQLTAIINDYDTHDFELILISSNKEYITEK